MSRLASNAVCDTSHYKELRIPRKSSGVDEVTGCATQVFSNRRTRFLSLSQRYAHLTDDARKAEAEMTAGEIASALIGHETHVTPFGRLVRKKQSPHAIALLFIAHMRATSRCDC